MKVTGFEVDPRKVEKLALGESYIGDVPSSEVAPLVKRGLFSATTDFDELAQMDVVSICVPTPLSKTRDPDMSYVVQATEDVRRRLRKGQLIILESTTYPGTTDELMKNDPRMNPTNNPMPFDGKRMIYGGFQPVVEILK